LLTSKAAAPIENVWQLLGVITPVPSIGLKCFLIYF